MFFRGDNFAISIGFLTHQVVPQTLIELDQKCCHMVIASFTYEVPSSATNRSVSFDWWRVTFESSKMIDKYFKVEWSLCGTISNTIVLEYYNFDSVM